MDRIPAFRRVILADIPPWKGALWAAVAVAVPTALRWAFDRGATGVPFITYFPAVLLAALFLGWRWGAVVAVVAGLVANRLFLPDPLRFYSNANEAVLTGLFALSCAVLVWVGEMCRRLVRELEATKDRETMLNHELMHRVKNMLATVNAMAVLTARHCEPGQFGQIFTGRMRALDKANSLLGTGHHAQCQVLKLVESATEPFRSGENFAIEGPDCELPRDACVPLSLALHELCTNAAKYGALSRAEGRVRVVWTIGEGTDGLLRLAWRENGGPPVAQPTRTGMGTQLLRRQRGLGKVDVRFEPTGLCCDIEVAGVAPQARAA